jgi:hypothetical protein
VVPVTQSAVFSVVIGNHKLSFFPLFRLAIVLSSDDPVGIFELSIDL